MDVNITERESVVVLRPGALGDTLVAVDALAALRRAYPGAAIELVGNRTAGDLLRDAGLVDRVVAFDSAEVSPLFLDPPEVAARWHGAALVVVWLNDPLRIADAFGRAGARLIVAASPFPVERDIHVADHLIETLRAGGVRLVRGEALTLLGPKNDVPRKGIVIHPGSGAARKNWAAAHYAVLIEVLQARGEEFTLLQGPADVQAVAAVRRALGGLTVPIIAPIEIKQTVEVLRRAVLVVGNDSGVSHLGARIGTPTVAIFVATDPSQWAPRGPWVSIVGSGGSGPAVEEVLAAANGLLDRRPWDGRLTSAVGATVEHEDTGEERDEHEDGHTVNHVVLPESRRSPSYGVPVTCGLRRAPAE
ncbi:MAG: hypothetical protein QOF51_3866 [Chloroflexota bacterium]|nr:hypothetical protein [Chloroflexota bacterium]